MEMSDLQELLAGWQGMELPPDRQAHLLQRLREDRDLRKALVDEIRIVSMSRTVQAAEPRWLALADELGRDPGYDSQMQLLEMGIHGRLEDETAPIVSAWWRRAAILALAMGVVLAAAASWFYLQDRSNRRAVAENTTLAVVVAADQCEWGIGSDQKPVLNAAVRAGILELESGEISLAFLSGVTLNIKGPAVVEVRAIDHIGCRRGTLRVNVPPDAKGFTVRSPGAAIVDLGSEFVVDVRSTGHTRLTVLQGRVQASVLSKDGASVRELVVEESKSVEIDPEQFKITDTDAVRKVPGARGVALPRLKLAANYPDIIRAAGPWAYWRCEEIVDGVIANEMPGGVPLQLNGALSIEAEEGANHSIEFGPGDVTQFLGTRAEWMPPESGCAIELCFAVESYLTCSIASAIGTENNGQHMLVELLSRGQKPGDKPGGMRYLYRASPGDDGGFNLYSKRLYVPKRWHHLVAQHTGPHIQLFLDGNPAGEGRLDVAPGSVPSRLVFGRIKDIATPDTRSFIGHIDEIALYDRPLKPEEIAAHARAALGR